MKTIREQCHSIYKLVSTVWQMFKLFWQVRPFICMSLIMLEVTQGVFPLLLAWVSKALFDLLALSLQGQAIQWRNLILLLSFQAGLALAAHLLQPLNTYLNGELGRQLSLKVQMTLCHKVNSLAGLASFEEPHFYNAIDQAGRGARFGPQKILFIFLMLVRNFSTFFTFLGTLIAFNPFLVAIVGLAAIPQFYAQIKLGKQRYVIEVENTPKERRASYYESVQLGVKFAKELRLFNLGDYFLQKWKSLVKEIQNTQRQQQHRELNYQIALETSSSTISSLAFVVVAISAFTGRLSLGDVTLYLSAVGSIQGALTAIVLALANVNESALFFSNYNNLLALPQTIHISPSPWHVSSLAQEIKIRHVHFRYGKEYPWVLKDVNLDIPVGKCLALVGLNGAGKTTLVKLLTRMYDPTEGQILWNGVDIREYDVVELRKYIRAIFQDFVHFDLTAFENIVLGDLSQLTNGDQKTCQKAVEEAALKAGVHDVLIALPQGYQTILSRWIADDGYGVDVSGGEWQKIALARTFLRDADLLILDEPTSALDPQAEYDIYSHFVEMISGKTSLLISHRLSTVRMADIIAVLENGEIIEQGSHHDLMKLNGRYAQLFNMQANRYR